MSGRRSASVATRTLVLLQTTIPAYRQPVLDELDARLGAELHVACGVDGFETTVRLAASHPRLRLLRNHFLGGRRLLWQSGGLFWLVRADVVMLELNPRILSSWVVLVIRRLAGRRTVLWGHAWSRQGAASRTAPVRHWMRRLGDAIVVYTETQARELRERMQGKTIVAAPNGLYPRRLAVDPSPAAPPWDVVFCGRLIASKKPGRLVEAFLAAADRLPPDVRLVIVGDGPLRADLESRARSLQPGRALFTGEVTSFEPLREIYGSALVSVSPGTVGLSLIQSLWFGVPAIIARDEPHGPEIEAAVEGQNAVMVESDSVAALSDAMLRVVGQRDDWLARRSAIAASCVDRYSVESMGVSLALAMTGGQAA